MIVPSTKRKPIAVALHFVNEAKSARLRLASDLASKAWNGNLLTGHIQENVIEGGSILFQWPVETRLTRPLLEPSWTPYPNNPDLTDRPTHVRLGLERGQSAEPTRISDNLAASGPAFH